MTSSTGVPSSPCQRMNAFCASEHFDAFIAFRSSQPGKLARTFPVQNEGLFRERIIRRARFPATAPEARDGSTGDEICRTSSVISRDRAMALAKILSGRALPVWSGCARLSADEIFLLGEHAESFDDRYFGPIDASSIESALSPSPSSPLSWSAVMGAGRSIGVKSSSCWRRDCECVSCNSLDSGGARLPRAAWPPDAVLGLGVSCALEVPGLEVQP
jgi:signal peptidase S26 family